MALHMELKVNDRRIGFLIAQRVKPQLPGADDMCQYDWWLNINDQTYRNVEPLHHRFGDGAWRLVAAIIRAAQEEPIYLDNPEVPTWPR